MKATSGFAVLVLLLGYGTTSEGDDHGCIGPGPGLFLEGEEQSPCPGSTLLMHFDGTAEGACAWQDNGVAPPDWGAWADGYEASGVLCGIQFWFSTLSGAQQDQTMDVYVWSADGTNPAAVLALSAGLDPGPIALWPAISAHDVAMPETAVTGEFFVGYWGEWPGEFPPAWRTCCDYDGPSGKPRTKIAEGLPYPSGWQDPSIVFGPIQNNAIGPYVLPEEVPVSAHTWGSVKSLYR